MQLFGKLHRSVLLYHITFFHSVISVILLYSPSNLICFHICLWLPISISLRIQVFWDVTWFCWVWFPTFGRIIQLCIFKGQAVQEEFFLGCLTLVMTYHCANLKPGISYPYIFFYLPLLCSLFFIMCTCAPSAWLVPVFLQCVRVNGPFYYK
jgi:hypothetical protein